MHTQNTRRLSQIFSLTLALILILSPGSIEAASSWSPTLLVNTEAFQTIDAGDGSSNMELLFGTSSKTLKFLFTQQRFQFSHSLNVIGNISGTTLNINGAASVNSLTATGAIRTKGTFSGATLRIGSGGADVQGSLNASGAVRTDSDLTINDDAGAVDAVFTFGNATANQTLKFLNTTQKFQFTKSLSILGTLSGS
ncbi:hypothetical protein EXS65_03960, partial [Candidatus Peribacteria bacterium]|nr:hypothetical protein [Candidatus Peribacteria bacterium]